MKVDIRDLSSDILEKDLYGLCSKTIRLFNKDDADFKKNTYDLNIDVGADLSRVCLVKGVTYVDKMGNCTNRDIETVTKTQWIRKGFWIHQPEADSAQLLVYLNNKPSNNSRMFVRVNEQATVIFKEVGGREYWHACWTSIPISVDSLRVGLKTFLFQAEGNESWEVLVELSRLPNRSAKSRDAGRNWDDEHLGVNDVCDGEYMIRLKME